MSRILGTAAARSRQCACVAAVAAGKRGNGARRQHPCSAVRTGGWAVALAKCPVHPCRQKHSHCASRRAVPTTNTPTHRAPPAAAPRPTPHAERQRRFLLRAGSATRARPTLEKGLGRVPCGCARMAQRSHEYSKIAVNKQIQTSNEGLTLLVQNCWIALSSKLVPATIGSCVRTGVRRCARCGVWLTFACARRGVGLGREGSSMLGVNTEDHGVAGSAPVFDRAPAIPGIRRRSSKRGTAHPSS